MPNRILIFTESGVCLVRAAPDSWEKYGISMYKTAHFEDVIKELKTGRYLLLVVSLSRHNAVMIQQQLKVLRNLTNIPIAIVAEEPVDTSSKIATLINGADQFMELPLSLDEAALTILAMIRRFTEYNEDNIPITVYFDHGVVVSPAHRKAFVSSMEIELVRKEFDILCLLVRNHGIVLTYDQILERVWGAEYIGGEREIIWNQIRRLRDKIQITPDLPQFIKTVHGVGYSFSPKYSAAFSEKEKASL